MSNLECILNEVAKMYMSTDEYARNLLLGVKRSNFELNCSNTILSNKYGLHNIKGLILLENIYDKEYLYRAFGYVYVDVDVGFLEYYIGHGISCVKQLNIITNKLIPFSSINLCENRNYNFQTDLSDCKFTFIHYNDNLFKQLMLYNATLYLGDESSKDEITILKIKLEDIDLEFIKDKFSFIKSNCKINPTYKVFKFYIDLGIYNIKQLEMSASNIYNILMQFFKLNYNFNVNTLVFKFQITILDGSFDNVNEILRDAMNLCKIIKGNEVEVRLNISDTTCKDRIYYYYMDE